MKFLKQQNQKTKDTINAHSGFLQVDKKLILNIATQHNIYAAFVYEYLLMCRNDITGDCYPSYNNISNATGICRKTVINTIKLLVQSGYIEYQQGGIITDTSGNKKHYANNYTFPLEQ